MEFIVSLIDCHISGTPSDRRLNWTRLDFDSIKLTINPFVHGRKLRRSTGVMTRIFKEGSYKLYKKVEKP